MCLFILWIYFKSQCFCLLRCVRFDGTVIFIIFFSFQHFNIYQPHCYRNHFRILVCHVLHVWRSIFWTIWWYSSWLLNTRRCFVRTSFTSTRILLQILKFLSLYSTKYVNSSILWVLHVWFLVTYIVCRSISIKLQKNVWSCANWCSDSTEFLYHIMIFHWLLATVLV